MTEAKKATPHFHGHRQRLRDRFQETDSKGLADYELLELILCRSNKRQDVKPLAKELLNRFGSFSEVLSAPIERLKECHGLGDSMAFDLKLIEAAVHRHNSSSGAKRKSFSSVEEVIAHCRSSMAFAEREQTRILFLDKRNGLIADEIQHTGTVDHTPLYPREVMKRALQLSASAIILIHNHPSGDPTPSAADIKTTKEVAAIAEPLGITVHDHLIIGRQGHCSMRESGLF